MSANGLRHRGPGVGVSLGEEISAALADGDLTVIPSPTASAPPRKSSQDGDAAGGPTRCLTLSAPGRLNALCCSIPGMVLFPMMALIMGTFCFSGCAFYVVTAGLTAFSLCFSVNLAFGCVVGLFHLRRDVRKDWHAMLRKLQGECPEAADVMHIVILPNYLENQDMLQHTLENLGAAPDAQSNMYVVLAMEGREGEAARKKAENLTLKTSHLFAGIAASYHPVGLPGDVPGKSSNSQWGYHEALRLFSARVSKLPASRIFLTVGDADTLWHPQFFSAIVYQALTMPEEERVWSIWQAPMMLFRNLDSAPSPTRTTGFATLLFELAGMTHQMFGPHCCYSSYSLTLALASHPLVGGWDRDVIAEDHHMFCKCYFASIWEALDMHGDHAGLSAGSKVRLRPVYLPAFAYLVESDGGWAASILARFQQARRHAQGIAELSYVFLQYFTLVACHGFFNLPVSVHRGTYCIAFKMISVHLMNPLQTFALTIATGAIGKTMVGWLVTDGIRALVASLATWQLPSGGELLSWAIPAIFGPVPVIGIALTTVVYIAVMDVKEGKLGSHIERRSQGAAEAGTVTIKSLGWKGAALEMGKIQADFAFMAQFTMLFFGLVPAILANWSLFRHGTKFEYIVAAKPLS